MVAIVGARNGSAAGQKLARMFASRIGRAGYVIASGLARGIDAAAHEAALDSGTVAVLAGGLDNIYPPEHAELQRQIGERGCLVSENPPGFVPRAQDFPRRNRIISGVALGVLIVEAARRSGTLITARAAADQGRVVFAVPGHPLDPRAEGTNRLLKDGATLATEPEDVIEVLAPMLAQPPPAGLGAHGRLAAAGSPAPRRRMRRRRSRRRTGPACSPPWGRRRSTSTSWSRATGLPVRALQIALIELALAGRIERHGHQLISLRRTGVRPLSLNDGSLHPAVSESGLTPSSAPYQRPRALAQRFPVGALEEVGQNLAIRLIRHYLQFLHHLGNVLEAVLGRSRQRGGDLGPDGGLAPFDDLLFPHLAGYASPGPPKTRWFSSRYLSLRNLMKRD